LRRAQLHVLRTQKDGKTPWAEPAYWAAFQLIGDFR
jgi:CHAT domain-containing protein